MESLQRAKAELIFWLQDAADIILGRREPLVPPRRLMFDGPRDPAIFKQNGQEFLRHYRDIAHLAPTEAVLDIGCGIGRKTVPLVTYLGDQGRYAGFDINRQGIDWCRTHITATHPNFEFTYVDVYNRRYNPKGQVEATALHFPYPDATFDFAVAASVFTHMFPAEVSHYLAEAARVLKPGGRAFFSFFLLGEPALSRLNTPASTYHFAHERGDCRVENPARPEDAVAYTETYLAACYRQAGLTIRQVFPGAWSGRAESLSFQDLILAEKPV